MARRPTPAPQLEPKVFTSVEEINHAITKMERRIKDIDELNVRSFVQHSTGEDEVVESNIRATIREISKAAAQIGQEQVVPQRRDAEQGD